jgi:hypothetical protein
MLSCASSLQLLLIIIIIVIVTQLPFVYRYWDVDVLDNANKDLLPVSKAIQALWQRCCARC